MRVPQKPPVGSARLQMKRLMQFDLALLVLDGHHGVFQVDQVLPLKFHQREANVVSFVGIVVLNGY